MTSWKLASEAFSGMCHTPRAAISALDCSEVMTTPIMGAAIDDQDDQDEAVDA